MYVQEDYKNMILKRLGLFFPLGEAGGYIINYSKVNIHNINAKVGPVLSQ